MEKEIKYVNYSKRKNKKSLPKKIHDIIKIGDNMQNMKESTENKINTVVNSPLLTTQNKISALEELKRKVLSHKQNNELSGMLREEHGNTNTLHQGKVFQKVSSDMKKAGLTSPLMLTVIVTMLLTSIVLIGIVIGSFL